MTSEELERTAGKNLMGAMLIASGVAEGCRESGRSLTQSQVESVRDCMIIVLDHRDSLMAERDATIAALTKENHLLRAWLSGELVIFNSEIDDKLAEMRSRPQAEETVDHAPSA